MTELKREKWFTYGGRRLYQLKEVEFFFFKAFFELQV